MLTNVQLISGYASIAGFLKLWDEASRYYCVFLLVWTLLTCEKCLCQDNTRLQHWISCQKSKTNENVATLFCSPKCFWLNPLDS